MRPEKAEIRLSNYAVSLKPVVIYWYVKSNVSISESPDESVRCRHQRSRMLTFIFHPNPDDYNIFMHCRLQADRFNSTFCNSSGDANYWLYSTAIPVYASAQSDHLILYSCSISIKYVGDWYYCPHRPVWESKDSHRDNSEASLQTTRMRRLFSVFFVCFCRIFFFFFFFFFFFC